MAIERVTYVAGSASIIRLPDRTEVLLEIVPSAVRLRKLGALGRPGDTIWEHRFSAGVRDGSPPARQALDVALESIDRAFSVDDAVRKPNEVAGPKLEALGGPQEPDNDDDGTPTIDPAELSIFRSAHVRANWVVALLAATIVIDVIAVGSGLAEVGLVGRAMNGAFITEAEATANDARQGLIGVLQTLLFVGTVIAFLMWLHRSHRNLQALHARDLRFTRLGGWLFLHPDTEPLPAVSGCKGDVESQRPDRASANRVEVQPRVCRARLVVDLLAHHELARHGRLSHQARSRE